MSRYFDNASTSFPKPAGVRTWLDKYLTEGGTYGRAASARNLDVSRTIEETRAHIAETIGATTADNIAFTPGATQSINTVLHSVAEELDNRHILISPLEHNSVMRPLLALAEKNSIEIEVMESYADGSVNLEAISRQLKPYTSLVIVNHMSNVNGVIQPVAAIKETIGDVPLLVDAAQSAGILPIEVERWKVDYLCFSAHKGYMGPTGIGGIYVRDRERITSFVRGGTGTHSASFEMPQTFPDRLEAGTPNIMGIYGWYGALTDRVTPHHSREAFLTLLHKLEELEQITIFKALNDSCQGEVFSITHNTLLPSEVALRLAENYGIETRSGLHCSPLAHQRLGTFPHGTVRLSLSPFHTQADLDALYEALQSL